MRIITTGEIDSVVDARDIVEELRHSYRGRTRESGKRITLVGSPGGSGWIENTSAWADYFSQEGKQRGFLGNRVSCSPPCNGPTTDGRADNASSVYILFSGNSGAPLALIDGLALDCWRRAAAAALASGYLAREDARHLLLLGASMQNLYCTLTLSALRRLDQVLVFEPEKGRADTTLRRLHAAGLRASATRDLEGALAGADIVQLAPHRLSGFHLIGDQLASGCHVNVLFDPVNIRQCFDAHALNECRFFSDYMSGTSREPEFAANLQELCQGQLAGRRYYQQRTVFACGGTALQDLCLAQYIFLRS
ncbi:hypothetical protein [Polycladidibacter hongkongensis]|uniref:hypothetical protein n=1 Tax=Polycladidibacter hongkongensis TaxID=1647556 RepID=UPI00082BE9F3|nr:hypothetical protein [Pseudovibrio hongkongensis]